MQCNGLESNKKFFEKKLKFYEKKKKTNLDKKFFFGNFPKFGNFLKFLSSIFSKGHVKNNVFHVWNTFDPSAICIRCNVLHNATTVAVSALCSRLLFVRDITIRYIRATTSSVQIRPHHHIDVYTDINGFNSLKISFW